MVAPGLGGFLGIGGFDDFPSTGGNFGAPIWVTWVGFEEHEKFPLYMRAKSFSEKRDFPFVVAQTNIYELSGVNWWQNATPNEWDYHSDKGYSIYIASSINSSIPNLPDAYYNTTNGTIKFTRDYPFVEHSTEKSEFIQALTKDGESEYHLISVAPSKNKKGVEGLEIRITRDTPKYYQLEVKWENTDTVPENVNVLAVRDDGVQSSYEVSSTDGWEKEITSLAKRGAGGTEYSYDFKAAGVTEDKIEIDGVSYVVTKKVDGTKITFTYRKADTTNPSGGADTPTTPAAPTSPVRPETSSLPTSTEISVLEVPRSGVDATKSGVDAADTLSEEQIGDNSTPKAAAENNQGTKVASVSNAPKTGVFTGQYRLIDLVVVLLGASILSELIIRRRK